MTREDFPDVLRLESSAVCNFNCKHCANGQKHPKQRGLLSEVVFNELTRQFMEELYVPRVVVLYHGGEPLINKKLPDYIRWFVDRGTKKVKIVSNGSLMTEEMASLLIDAGLTDIVFSFDGCSAEENDLIRCNGKFERDSKNVKRFLEIMPNEGLKVIISNVQIFTEEMADKWAKGEYKLSTPQYLIDTFAPYLDKIQVISYPAMIWPGFDKTSSCYDTIVIDNNQELDYCGNLFETISVLSNGDVVPCCYDIIGQCVFGNIMNESIFDIWEKKKFIEFRQAIRNSDPKGICKECMLFSHEYLLKNE